MLLFCFPLTAAAEDKMDDIILFPTMAEIKDRNSKSFKLVLCAL